jgi:hypothetical protein
MTHRFFNARSAKVRDLADNGDCKFHKLQEETLYHRRKGEESMKRPRGQHPGPQIVPFSRKMLAEIGRYQEPSDWQLVFTRSIDK